jgi:hypothetical protein
VNFQWFNGIVISDSHEQISIQQALHPVDSSRYDDISDFEAATLAEVADSTAL